MSEPTPQNTPSPGKRICPYCARETSATATFCWWCAREISVRPERPESSSSSQRSTPRWVWFVLGAAVVLGVTLLFFLT